MATAGSTKEERALHLLARVVSDNPFRARELIDRVCTGTRDAFGLKRVEWRPPHELVPVPDEGTQLDERDLSVLSALGEAAAAVAERARDVGDAERLKYDFVSVASHELRTPISVVHGIAATLHARVDDVQDQVGGDPVERDGVGDDGAPSLDEQLHVVGAAGPSEQFDPRERLEDLLARVTGDRADDVQLLVERGGAVVTDPVAFDRVAANLILNALRYGEPPVEVHADRSEGFRLIVEDHGPGVAPEFVPRLFERFTRSDESRREGSPGAGLGLAIANAYANAIGGELGYEAAEPSGARFTLSLPAARS
jgi:signal transduction histidine kinase